MKLLLLNAMLNLHGSEYRAVKMTRVTEPEKSWRVTVVNRVSGCEGTYRTTEWRKLP